MLSQNILKMQQFAAYRMGQMMHMKNRNSGSIYLMAFCVLFEYHIHIYAAVIIYIYTIYLYIRMVVQWQNVHVIVKKLFY